MSDDLLQYVGSCNARHDLLTLLREYASEADRIGPLATDADLQSLESNDRGVLRDAAMKSLRELRWLVHQLDEIGGAS